MPRVQVLASIDETADFDQVVAAAEKAGLQVQQKLEAAGVVIGEIEEAELAVVAAVPGVRAIERSSSGFQLPKPEDPVQ